MTTPKKATNKITLRELTMSTSTIVELRKVKTEKVYGEDKSFKESVITLKTKLAIGRATEQVYQELVNLDKLKAELFKECATEVNKGTEEAPMMNMELVPDSDGAKRFSKEIDEALDSTITLTAEKIKFSEFETMGFDADISTDMLMKLSFMLDLDN